MKSQAELNSRIQADGPAHFYGELDRIELDSII